MDLRLVDGMPDYAALIDLINAEWPSMWGDKTDAEKIEDMVANHSVDKDRIKILYEGDIPIGFYRYSLWPRDARETDSAHTYDIAVHPSRQGQGIGTMLMTDMISDCKQQGLKKLLSRTLEDNEASIGLHKKAGFRISFKKDESIIWNLVLEDIRE